MNRTRLFNFAVAAVAVLFVTQFVVLAEGMGRDRKNSNSLDAINTTTTFAPAQVAPSSTSTSSTPTTEFVLVTTTTAPRATSTTSRPTITTTATTIKKTTPTTRARTTSTTTGARGRVVEASDNSATFTHNEDGTHSDSATAVPANDPFSFSVNASVVSVSGGTANVHFVTRLDNKSGRTITFPGGLRVNLQITPPSGPTFVFELDALSVTSLNNGEAVTLSTSQDVSGYGKFDVVGSCEVDYGS